MDYLNFMRSEDPPVWSPEFPFLQVQLSRLWATFVSLVGGSRQRLKETGSERSVGADQQIPSQYAQHRRKIRTTVTVVLGSIQCEVKRVSERIKSLRNKVLDPHGSFLLKWNKVFVVSCVLAFSFDPLFFYIMGIEGKQKCIKLDEKLLVVACVLRTFLDTFYILHIVFQFFTGFIAPTSRVFGRGELVDDHRAIAKRYLYSHFIVDILAILPFPQVILLVILPKTDGSVSLVTKGILESVIFAQYVPRLLRIYPIFVDVRTSGIFTEPIWAGAAVNLFLYMLASHVVGAFWYLFSIKRQFSCWRIECEKYNCDVSKLYCNQRKLDFASLKDLAFLNTSCPLLGADEIKDSTVFNFGIFLDALQSQVVESRNFLKKLVYCLLWGLRNVSSLGQNLRTSTYVWEMLFVAFISVFGLVCFSSLIGIMLQTYLQSTSLRVDEMRVKKRDAEQWMSHRLLPTELRQRIRRYEQYKWQQTRGVVEDNFMRDLPKDLRRDIKRHLCLSLLMRVPMFARMDEQFLDAICDRLQMKLYTESIYILREGDPIDEMLFIMRGKVETVVVPGTGFFHASQLKAGDYCGEELLSWGLELDPSSTNIPISNGTVKTQSEVEAFALTADDLKSVFSNFPLVYINKLRLSSRCYSLPWRTWAACFIQAAWRRHYKRKLRKSLLVAEDSSGKDVNLRSASLQQRSSQLNPLPVIRVPEKPVDPTAKAIMSKPSTKDSVGKETDIVMEELKSLKSSIEAIAAARGHLRSYTEQELFQEIEKVGDMSDEMQMKVYQRLCEDPSAARAFMSCPVLRRALWLKVKFGASFFVVDT